MKNDRQAILLEIIEQEAVETQEQLLRLLAERGVKCTQATVSRDIKQLHLVKEPTGHGRYRYAVSVQKTKLNFAVSVIGKVFMAFSSFRPPRPT